MTRNSSKGGKNFSLSKIESTSCVGFILIACKSGSEREISRCVRVHTTHYKYGFSHMRFNVFSEKKRENMTLDERSEKASNVAHVALIMYWQMGFPGIDH